jgi:hypothetical protein
MTHYTRWRHPAAIFQRKIDTFSRSRFASRAKLHGYISSPAPRQSVRRPRPGRPNAKSNRCSSPDGRPPSAVARWRRPLRWISSSAAAVSCPGGVAQRRKIVKNRREEKVRPACRNSDVSKRVKCHRDGAARASFRLRHVWTWCAWCRSRRTKNRGGGGTGKKNGRPPDRRVYLERRVSGSRLGALAAAQNFQAFSRRGYAMESLDGGDGRKGLQEVPAQSGSLHIDA